MILGQYLNRKHQDLVAKLNKTQLRVYDSMEFGLWYQCRDLRANGSTMESLRKLGLVRQKANFILDIWEWQKIDMRKR